MNELEIIMVRHALPHRVDPGHDGDATIADPDLDAVGAMQAERLAEFLSAEAPTAVYASPARRAHATAVPLARRIGVPVVTEPGLAEWDASSTSYVPIEQLKADNDPRWQALRVGDFYEPEVDHGSYRARVTAAVEGLVAQHTVGPIVLLTHAGVINAYGGHVLNQEKAFWLALTRSPGYCSITRILAAEDGLRRIVSVNETAHVRDLLPA